MNVSVVGCSLIRLMLLHQRDELFGGPPFGLEIIIVGCRCASVHHEVDAASAPQDVCARDHSTPATEPFRWARVVECRRLAVQFHIPRENTGTEHPWVVEIARTAFNEHHVELVVEIGQTASHDTPATKSATNLEDF